MKGDQRWNELSAAHKIHLGGVRDDDDESSGQIYLKKALIDDALTQWQRYKDQSDRRKRSRKSNYTLCGA